MRSLLLLFCLTILANPLPAQEQERKLVDRLLKPNPSLVNSAQDKKFSGTDATPVSKEFVAGAFYSGKERTTKPFSGLKNFFARALASRKFSRAEAAAQARASADTAYASVFETKPSSLTRPAAEAKKSARTRRYADQHAFRGKGTRQKILSQQDRPLTIDEVRELLNKNE